MTVDQVRVGDVLRLRRISVELDPVKVYEEIGLRSFGKGVFHKEPVSGASLGSKRVFEIHSGDLLLSNVFAWEGAIAVAGPSEGGKIGSHRYMTYVPSDGRIDTGWARYFFLSDHGLELIRRASPGSAGRNRTLGIQAFEAIEIPLPPIEDQRDMIADLDRLGLWSKRIIDMLSVSSAEELLRTVPALAQEVISRNSSRRYHVGDLVEIVSDIVHPGEPVEPAEAFVGLQHVEPHTGRRCGSDALGSENGRKFRFQPGDVIYGYLRPYQNKAMVANLHGLCSVDQYVLRPRNGVSADAVGHVLRAKEFLDTAVALTHNLQLPRLRSGLLLNIDVDWPRDAVVVEELNRLVRRVSGAVDLRRAQVAIARALPSSILNQTFAGIS